MKCIQNVGGTDDSRDLGTNVGTVLKEISKQ
jgi:dihydroxyacetone kinase DhaKLM complex PTS-EIIA-like component DhaM